MTLWTDLFPEEPVLLGRKWFKDPATGLTHAVPALATHLRAIALGCGGQGAAYGGGGAYARSVVTVTPAETLRIQVGNTSTGSTPGDSWVKRADNTTIIVYADRGRGNGTGGQASNSVGQVLYNGATTSSSNADSASDLADFGSLGFFGRAYGSAASNYAAGPGGGGITYVSSSTSDGDVYVYAQGGCGLVCLEFFKGNPGY